MRPTGAKPAFVTSSGSPDVAVVIPAFNPGEYLTESVASALTQSMTNIEVVVVDDGSDNDAFPRLPADPRLRNVRQPQQGVSVARNRGVLETSAPLIAFLDADDRWLPTKLERQLVALSGCPEAALCYTGFLHIDRFGVRGAAGDVSTDSGYHALLAHCAIPMSSVVMRREVFLDSGGFDPFYFIVQDWELWLRLADQEPFVLLPDPLVEYRVGAHNVGQLSGDPLNAFAEAESVYVRHEIRAMRRGDKVALDLIAHGRRANRRLRSRQAADRFVDSIRRDSAPDWAMLNAALRIQRRDAVRAVARRAARRFRSEVSPRHRRAA
jgi:glycosyltransferase involved in cell wall biosynthesis